MSGTVTEDFEKLCDAEFGFASREAYEGLDRQIAEIKTHMSAAGSYLSDATGRAVVDAVLSRFDRILLAFEEAYLEEWRRDGSRALPESDYAWLIAKVSSQLEPGALEVERRVNGSLWEGTLFFQRFWEQAKIEANRRCGKIREKIDLLKMQKAHSIAEASRPKTRPANPFDGLGNPMDKKAQALLGELRRCFEAQCWNARGILMRILLERAFEALEPACRAKKGLGAKLDFCIGQPAGFGQSMTDVLKHLKAAKLTGDIIAHDSTLLVEQTDVDISAPYFRHLIAFWASRPAAPVVGILFSRQP